MYYIMDFVIVVFVVQDIFFFLGDIKFLGFCFYFKVEIYVEEFGEWYGIIVVVFFLIFDDGKEKEGEYKVKIKFFKGIVDFDWKG